MAMWQSEISNLVMVDCTVCTVFNYCVNIKKLSLSNLKKKHMAVLVAIKVHKYDSRKVYKWTLLLLLGGHHHSPTMAQARALSYYSDLTLSQEFQPMAAQVSTKAVLPLAKILATASCRSSNTGPRIQLWMSRHAARHMNALADVMLIANQHIGWRVGHHPRTLLVSATWNFYQANFVTLFCQRRSRSKPSTGLQRPEISAGFSNGRTVAQLYGTLLVPVDQNRAGQAKFRADSPAPPTGLQWFFSDLVVRIYSKWPCLVWMTTS